MSSHLSPTPVVLLLISLIPFPLAIVPFISAIAIVAYLLEDIAFSLLAKHCIFKKVFLTRQTCHYNSMDSSNIHWMRRIKCDQIINNDIIYILWIFLFSLKEWHEFGFVRDKIKKEEIDVWGITILVICTIHLHKNSQLRFLLPPPPALFLPQAATPGQDGSWNAFGT